MSVTEFLRSWALVFIVLAIGAVVAAPQGYYYGRASACTEWVCQDGGAVISDECRCFTGELTP